MGDSVGQFQVCAPSHNPVKYWNIKYDSLSVYGNNRTHGSIEIYPYIYFTWSSKVSMLSISKYWTSTYNRTNLFVLKARIFVLFIWKGN